MTRTPRSLLRSFRNHAPLANGQGAIRSVTAFGLLAAAFATALGCASNRDACLSASDAIAGVDLQALRAGAIEDPDAGRAALERHVAAAAEASAICSDAGDTERARMADTERLNALEILGALDGQVALAARQEALCAVDAALLGDAAACCGVDVLGWSELGCDDKVTGPEARFVRPRRLCEALSQGPCTLDAAPQADESVSWEGTGWSVRYCPQGNCEERAGRMRALLEKMGGAESTWIRANTSYAVVHDPDRAPPVTPDQDALVAQLFDSAR